MQFALLTAIILSTAFTRTIAQDSTSILDKGSNFPDKFLGALNKKTTLLDRQLTRQTEKYLQRFQKREDKLKRKLYKLDSNATKNLFLLNTDQQYASYLKKIKSDSTYDPSKMSGNYIPFADTLQCSLAFLKQNPDLISSSKLVPAEVQGSLVKLQQLQAKMQDADQLQQYISQRKEQIKQYLLQFAHIPSGVQAIYYGYNKDLYYYGQQVREYKDLLNDPDRLIQKALGLIEKLPFFQAFMQKNSMLASLFPNSGVYGTTQAITGLETRDQIMLAIGSQLSGPNAQQAFSGNLSSAQTQMDDLKTKLMNYGSGGGDVDMPNFRPNTQKTKGILQRLEYGTNMQTQSSSYFFPVTTDFGLSVGYKLNDHGNAIGLGGSYKLGWGRDISHVSLSGQGASIRSYGDFKMKGSFYFSGGLEYNYQQPFYSINIVKSLNSWQQSGLMGVSKIISMNTKFFKKAKLQFLWDFLSYQSVPKAQPFKFRINYSF